MKVEFKVVHIKGTSRSFVGEKEVLEVLESLGEQKWRVAALLQAVPSHFPPWSEVTYVFLLQREKER